MELAWDKEKFCLVWRKGGNWVAFFLFWIISSAIVSQLEHSEQNKELTMEEQTIQSINGIKGWIMGMQMEEGKNDTIINDQTEKLVNLLGNPKTPKLWAKLDIEDAIYKENLVQPFTNMIKNQFKRIKDDNEEEDEAVGELATRFLSFFSEQDTISFINKTLTNHANVMKKMREERKNECGEKREKGLACEEQWSFGDSLHYTSTIFTATGYGAKTAITSAGKFVTILMIMTQLPFFLHCLATSARNINQWLDNFFGLSDKHDDIDDLTEGGGNESNNRQRMMVMVKGLLVLTGVLAVHMLIASIYTSQTTEWTFGNVLYFQFVNYASIGFGDLIPEDEFTVAGAIFKNLLIKIPAEIILFAMLVRVLHSIS